jgi:small subunit ribosomal protein S8
MSLSDPIADLLTRLRNALNAGFPKVDCPASRVNEDICRVLKDEGYILDFSRDDDGKQGMLHIKLKYHGERDSVITGIRRVSKPSLRVYSGAKEIKPVRSGLGISIMTTSKGVMSGRDAQKQKLGGEILCEVW